ncbi:uncharacterized protein LOC119102501 [Pollicipes pollicipes]|uniref:uncharacterized protein LOC119102501 n=1 Tax=Pollicipes pollicipes TaxID=41117 RepID=UPI001884B720|nr:uncharacterized protein LOC119102501 [Pollicipes pollicipes]
MSLTRSLLVAALAVAAAAVPFPGRGHSSSSITFVDTRQPSKSPAWGNRGGNIQFGQTSATSNQQSTGDTQTNQGQATGVSVQQQTGLGGAVQTTNNAAAIEALQQAGGGGGGGSQSSNNQVNIMSTQLQQNVEGTLVNVEAGHTGVVIVNTNDQDGVVTGQQVVNNRPIAPATEGSSRCRYTCRRNTGQLYCCDDGTNRGGPPAIHGGKCPPVRLLCPQNNFIRKCAHDGQCLESDKCCYDTCANTHICTLPDSV